MNPTERPTGAPTPTGANGPESAEVSELLDGFATAQRTPSPSPQRYKVVSPFVEPPNKNADNAARDTNAGSDPQ